MNGRYRCFWPGLPVSLGLLLLAAPLRAQEWTRFRGPNGQGISDATTVPVQFTAADYNWRVPLPGAGHSSPVIWENRIFLTAAQAEPPRRHLICLNAADGQTLWVRSWDFQPYLHHRYNNFAAGTPAVDAERVYVLWPAPDSVSLIALDHRGNEVWKRNLGPQASNHGGAASPIVLGELVIARVDSDEGGPPSVIVALDRKTGAVRWKCPRGNKDASYSTPCLYQPRSGPPQLVFTSNANGMFALDPETGQVLWEVPTAFSQRCVSSPVLAGSLIFATAGNGGGARQAVAVRPGGPGQAPGVAYSVTRGVPYVPTPIAYKGLLFLWGDSGIVACVRADTGERVWMERVGGNYFGSPICVNGKLYAISADGELAVVEASDQFRLLAKIPLGEPSHATPAVANGVLYLRTETHLISVGGRRS